MPSMPQVWTRVAMAMILNAISTAAQAEALRGKVVGITDGDTVTLRADGETYRVRLMGIDAPEMRQAFGSAAKKTLSDCAFGKRVEVVSRKRDFHGRLIGQVFADRLDCGLRQVELGMAWHYKAYANEQEPSDRAAYARAEDQARAARLGLWTESALTAPWDFRHPKQ
jgi:endonuclease YncB( thermonuclease family)